MKLPLPVPTSPLPPLSTPLCTAICFGIPGISTSATATLPERFGADGNPARISVVLAGHPKLRNDLRRPTMEEIGYRTDIFTLDGITGSQREYIQWLLKTSTGKGKPEDILTTEAVDLLAMKLRTPLQVQLHLTLAMEAGYQTGEKPITATLVESVLSRQLDDLEPTLTRHGYRLKDMVEQFDAKPAEIRALFNNQLDPARTAELRDRMLAVGLPI